MGRVHEAIAAWESHTVSPPAIPDEAKEVGALPVTPFRLSPENGFDNDVVSKEGGSSDIPRSRECLRLLDFKGSSAVESFNSASAPSLAVHPLLATDNTSGEYEEDECSPSAQLCETSLVSDLGESRNYSVPDYKDDIWIDVHGRGLQVSVRRPRLTKEMSTLEVFSLCKKGEQGDVEFSEGGVWDSFPDVAASTDSFDSSHEMTLAPHLNSSLDRSESERFDTEDAFDNLDGISQVAGSQSHSRSNLCVQQALQDLCPKHTNCPASGLAVDNSSSRAIFDKKGNSICAVIGAETFLGSHVLQALLLTRSHHIKALVTSAEVPEHLSLLVSDFLSVVLIGDLRAESSRIALHDTLYDAETVVDCSNVDLSDVRTSQVADTILESARGLVEALDHPNSSVKRLIYCGSDLAVWDPRESSVNGPTIEELDENDWFSIMDDDRKLSHAEAHGRAAAEMYLWTRAAGDRVPYSMCSVITSLVLGPVLSSAHASSAGPLFLNNLASSHGIPLLPTPFADVRDVALVVSKLIGSHDSTCGRVFVSQEPETTASIVAHLETIYPGNSRYVREVPRWAVSTRNCSPWRLSRKGLKDRYGKVYGLRVERAQEELGVRFRPVSETLRDTIESLQSFGLVEVDAKKRSLQASKVRTSSRIPFVGRGRRHTAEYVR